MNFRLPKEAKEGRLGYSYNLDELKLCKKLQQSNVCEDSPNKEKCLEELQDEVCVETVDFWLDKLNRSCSGEINAFEMCNEVTDKCLNEKKALKVCVNHLEKPEWLDTNVISNLK